MNRRTGRLQADPADMAGRLEVALFFGGIRLHTDLPLAKNKPEIVGMAKAIKRSLQPLVRAVYDDTGGIGKLYARQDEIGTPFCVTVDHQSLEDEAVTVRDRDTWEQERVKVSDLSTHLLSRLSAGLFLPTAAAPLSEPSEI